TRRSGSGYGRDFSRIPLTTLKIALFAPTPIAIVRIVTSANSGDRHNRRIACRSCCLDGRTETTTRQAAHSSQISGERPFQAVLHLCRSIALTTDRHRSYSCKDSINESIALRLAYRNFSSRSTPLRGVISIGVFFL